MGLASTRWGCEAGSAWPSLCVWPVARSEHDDSFGDGVDPSERCATAWAICTRLLCPFSRAISRPPEALQVRQLAWRFSLAKKRSGRWLEGMM
jgi:hypothetical protein